MPRLARWLNYWRFPRELWRAVLQQAGELDPVWSRSSSSCDLNLWDMQRVTVLGTRLHGSQPATARIPEYSLPEWAEACEKTRQYLTELLVGLCREVEHHEDAHLERYLDNRELFDAGRFMLQINLHCQHRYGITPDVLLALARRGDPSALTRLLELDPAVMHLPELEPLLVQRLQQSRPAPDLQTPRTLPLSLLDVQALVSGWILEFSRELQGITKKLWPRRRIGKLSLTNVCELLGIDPRDRSAFRARVSRTENSFPQQLCDIFGR